MRAPVLAMFYAHDEKKLAKNVIKASEITHAHPLAIEGAKIIAFTTRAALYDEDTQSILHALPDWCKSAEYESKISLCTQFVQSDTISTKEIKNSLGNGIAATDSSITAVYFALKFRELPFKTMLNQIYKLGGDTDTIGAMSGAIWGAFNGITALEPDSRHCIENEDKIISLSERLYTVASKSL